MYSFRGHHDSPAGTQGFPSWVAERPPILTGMAIRDLRYNGRTVPTFVEKICNRLLVQRGVLGFTYRHQAIGLNFLPWSVGCQQAPSLPTTNRTFRAESNLLSIQTKALFQQRHQLGSGVRVIDDHRKFDLSAVCRLLQNTGFLPIDANFVRTKDFLFLPCFAVS